MPVHTNGAFIDNVLKVSHFCNFLKIGTFINFNGWAVKNVLVKDSDLSLSNLLTVV